MANVRRLDIIVFELIIHVFNFLLRREFFWFYSSFTLFCYFIFEFSDVSQSIHKDGF